MTDEDLEEFLSSQNEYTTSSWIHRLEQIKILQQAVLKISKIGKKEKGMK